LCKNVFFAASFEYFCVDLDVDKEGIMSRLKLYILSGLVAVGFLFRAAIPALTQEPGGSEVAQSGDPLVSSAGPVIVVDKNGAEVGPYENIGGTDSVLEKIGSGDFALQISTKGFVATGVTFSFSTLACTGTRYVVSPPSSFYFSYPKTANPTGVNESLNGGVAGTILYYAEPKTSTSVSVKSELVIGTSGKSMICYPIPSTKTSVSKVVTTDLSKLPFVTPFKLSF
jgi:hypothetical protein